MYMVGQAAIDAEDYAVASRKAQEFMRALFGSSMPVKCTCGDTIKYKNNKLMCPNCGVRNKFVSYEDDYGDKLIRTVIDVNKKEFTLEQMDFDE